MSPSGGLMTTVDSPMMWSPEKSSRSSSSWKQRWFDAWPGVWTALRRNSVASMPSPSASARSITRSSAASKASTSAPVRSLRPAAPGEWSGWVWVQTIQRMASPPHPAIASRWVASSGSGIDDDDLVDADQVGVRAGTGHHARVVADDAPHQRAQRGRHLRHERLRSGRRGSVDVVRGAVGHASRSVMPWPPGRSRWCRRCGRSTSRPDRRRRSACTRVVTRVAGQHDAHAAVDGDDARQDRRHVGDLGGRGERVAGGGEPGDGPQAGDRRRHHRELAGRVLRAGRRPAGSRRAR